MKNSFPINEIFYSVQGEGERLGVPSIFVRTTGCNLRCWWCDTPDTSFKPEGTRMEMTQIWEEINSLTDKKDVDIVLTGGEPMKLNNIKELLASFYNNNFVTIETNGTIPPRGCLYDLASISPKLSHSFPKNLGLDWKKRHNDRRINIEALSAWVREDKYQLKFVIDCEDDVEEVEEIIKSIGNVDRNKVILMPEGRDDEEIREKSLWIVDVCKKKGFRYTPRVTVYLWGGARGI